MGQASAMATFCRLGINSHFGSSVVYRNFGISPEQFSRTKIKRGKARDLITFTLSNRPIHSVSLLASLHHDLDDNHLSFSSPVHYVSAFTHSRLSLRVNKPRRRGEQMPTTFKLDPTSPYTLTDVRL